MIKKGGNIIDLGCGDGDLIQNFVNYRKIMEKKSFKIKNLNILGIDLNQSRIINSKNL